MPHSVQLSYSLDGGTTFSTAIAYTVLEIWLDLVPVSETEGSQDRLMGDDAPLCQKSTPRLKGSMRFAWENFDTSVTQTPAANDKMRALQYWAAAPLRRIYFANCANHFYGGWDLFSTSTNTNYVVVDSVDYAPVKASGTKASDSTGRKIVDVVIEFTLRNAPVLKLWNGSAFA